MAKEVALKLFETSPALRPPQGIYELAEQLGVKVRGSIYTHYHFDHCGGDVHPMFTQVAPADPVYLGCV